jgi:hypothetical protein
VECGQKKKAALEATVKEAEEAAKAAEAQEEPQDDLAAQLMAEAAE